MLSNTEIDAIYIHVPFCIRKCGYCDFLSFPVDTCDVDKYIHHLVKEIKMYDQYSYDTVYIGGGTPSILDIKYIKYILENINIRENAEITIEVNPKTVDLYRLRYYKALGINRISIGVQSFNDAYLKILGRTHDSNTAINTYDNARKAGFDNISLDLMFSLPQETLDGLDKDLDKLFELYPEHFSIYSLIWEENTPFYERLKKGELKETDNDMEAQMYERIIDRARGSGYVQYEISNFARSNHFSRHNMKYWENKKYVGVGLGAAGYIGDIRYKNIRDINGYYSMLDTDVFPIVEKEKISAEDNEKYSAILNLRMLQKGFLPRSDAHKNICERLKMKGMLDNKDDHYILTRKGLLIANDVMEEFL